MTFINAISFKSQIAISTPAERSIIRVYSLIKSMGNNSHGFSPHKKTKKTKKTAKRLAAKKVMHAERASKKKKR